MKIPQSFKKGIKTTFYDKKVHRYSQEEVNNQGWVTIELVDLVDPFYANVQFKNLGQIQEDYGIRENIDVAMSTDAEVDLNSIVKYHTRFYKIIQSIPSDSHNLLIGEKWEE